MVSSSKALLRRSTALARSRQYIALNVATNPPSLNTFCPTGKGGGIDPSCSPKSKGLILSKGRKKKSGDYAFDDDIPVEPGTSPIPKDHIRFFHYSNVHHTEGTLESQVHDRAVSLRTKGIKMSSAKGEVTQEPNQIWASSKMPDNISNKIFVEFSLAVDDPRIGGTYKRLRGSAEEIHERMKIQRDATFVGDISPKDIIAVHEPWHFQARYLLEHAPTIEKAKAGGFDSLLKVTEDSLNEYAASIRRAKDTDLTSLITNVFCPTGPGGGVNPGCSPKGKTHRLEIKGEIVPVYENQSKEQIARIFKNQNPNNPYSELRGMVIRGKAYIWEPTTEMGTELTHDLIGTRLLGESNPPANTRFWVSEKNEWGRKVDLHISAKYGKQESPEVEAWASSIGMVTNVFCPTGKGGGVDATCSPGGKSVKGGSVEKEALKAIGPKLSGLLKTHGVKIVSTDRSDVGDRGGAAYLKYQGTVAITKTASKADVVHELGHAVDAAFHSKVRIKDRTFDQHKYWSEKNLKTSLKADLKAATPKKPGPSWENKASSWKYAFSSEHEAFAHIFAAIHGDETKINNFSVKDVMPKSYAAVEKQLKAVKKSPTTNAAKKKRLNPLKYDPTRTTTIQRTFEEQFSKRFKKFQRELIQLLVSDDALGLKQLTANTFCPTGPGGGVDPSCSPSGKKSSPTETKAFKNWFAGSKVVQRKTGKPLRVYHGTIAPTDFHQFKAAASGSFGTLDQKIGVHFAEDLKSAQSFALKYDGRVGRMYPVYLSVKNPLIVKQRRMENGSLEGDAVAINREIRNAAFPNNKPLFVDWVTKARMVTKEQGSEIFDRLSKGESIGDREYNGVAGHNLNSPRRTKGEHPVSSYVGDYDGSLQMLNETERTTVLDTFKSEMRRQGYDGIRYTNTAPMETIGVKNRTAWIVFESSQVKSAIGNRGTWDPNDPLITNTRWKFHSTQEKIDNFEHWIISKLTETMEDKDVHSGLDWWQMYIDRAFRMGSNQGYTAVKGKSPSKDQRASDQVTGAKNQAMSMIYGMDATKERLKILTGRTFKGMKGLTDTMKSQLTQELTDGLIQGLSPRAIAQNLVKRVGINKNRAMTIARTETVRAYNEGNLAVYKALGVKNIGVKVEILVSGKACPKCQKLKGKIFTLEKAEGLLPVHPNCRCAHTPYISDEPSPQKERQKSWIERSILSVTRKQPLIGNAKKGWSKAARVKSALVRKAKNKVKLTRVPDPEWKAGRLELAKSLTGDMKKLNQKLTSTVKGSFLIPNHDPDAGKILKSGKLFSMSGRVRVKGKPNNCHGNSCDFLKSKKIDAIATGYVLADNGAWRSHSWGIKKGRIVETTDAGNGALAYFGIVLSKAEAKQFQTLNVFCPTGSGGGINPTCSPKGSKPTDTQAFKTWFGKSKVVDKAGKPLVVYHGTNDPTSFTQFNTKGEPKLTGAGAHFTDNPKMSSHYALGKVRGGSTDSSRSFPVYLSIKNPLDFESKSYSVEKLKSIIEPGLSRLSPSRAFDFASDHWYRYDNLPNDHKLTGDQFFTVVQELYGNDKVNRVLAKHGFDGIKHRAEDIEGTWAGLLGTGEDHGIVWVAFEDTQVKSAIGNKGTWDPNDPVIANVFCPTGSGGGIDPTCSPASLSLDLNQERYSKHMSQPSSKKNPKSGNEEPPEMNEKDEKLLDKIWDKQSKQEQKKSK